MAAKTTVKTTSKPTPRRRRIFTNARLITVETLLLVGVLQVWFKKWLVTQEQIPGYAMIALLMILMVGILGFLVFYLEDATKRSLAKAHEAVLAVPIPVPLILIHLAAFIGLYWLYGHVYGIAWLPSSN